MPIPTVRRWRVLVATTATLSFSACTDDGSRAISDDLGTSIATDSTGSATSTGPALTSSTSTTTTSTTSTTTTSTTLPPTTTTEPLVVEGAIVMIANSADLPGAAAEMTASLAALGFSMGEPTNGAIYDTLIEITKIYAREDAAAVAGSLSRVLGGVTVERMPTPAPISGANDTLGGATVLVMLGRDLAGAPLPS